MWMSDKKEFVVHNFALDFGSLSVSRKQVSVCARARVRARARFFARSLKKRLITPRVARRPPIAAARKSRKRRPLLIASFERRLTCLMIRCACCFFECRRLGLLTKSLAASLDNDLMSPPSFRIISGGRRRPSCALWRGVFLRRRRRHWVTYTRGGDEQSCSSTRRLRAATPADCHRCAISLPSSPLSSLLLLPQTSCADGGGGGGDNQTACLMRVVMFLARSLAGALVSKRAGNERRQ